jgi:large subunit ribosomal protein L25
MATILDLQAQTRKRSGTSSVRRMRKEGLVPAVIYGSTAENSNIKVDAKTFASLLKNSASDNLLVNIQIDGEKTQLALIQDVQHDHLRGGILHVDFHAVGMDETIHASVPLEFAGEAEGVKAGGQMDIMIHKLHVRCKPGDLPEKIVVDITGVGVGGSVHVKDVVLPQGVSVPLEGSVLILSISTPRVVESPAAAAKAKK